MILNINRRLSGIEVYNQFIAAIIFYLIPFISLVIFFIGELVIDKTAMVFWVIFLVSPIPCGITGLILSIIGLVKSVRRKNKLNKILGILGVIGGVLIFCGGILGLLMIYVVVGG